TLARETYLDALSAAIRAGEGVREIAEAVPVASSRARRGPDLLLEGLALLATDGYAAGAPSLKQALRAFVEKPMPEGDALRWLWLACQVARALGDDAAWDQLTSRQLRLVRDAGALALLPIALDQRLEVELSSGNLAAARSLVAEADATRGATG